MLKLMRRIRRVRPVLPPPSAFTGSLGRIDHGAMVAITGHALIQNIRRGHYKLGIDQPVTRRVAAAFSELALAS